MMFRSGREVSSWVMRSICSLAVLGCGVLLGCSGSAPPPESSFRVALVTPGPISDAGWNAAAHAGLLRMAEELDAEIYHLEASTPAEFEEAFRDFASRRCDLVFGHGFEFQDAAVEVARGYPETAFVVTSGRTVSDNVAGLVFRLEDAAYLAGVWAAKASRSGISAMVGGMDIPPVRLVFDGFRKGFTDTRPDGSVKEVYLGNWEDVAAARQATVSLARQGVDIVIHNADAAGLGVFQACRELQMMAFGTNADQAQVAPDVVLASAVMDIPMAMVRVAEDVKNGEFQGRVYAFDLASGVVGLVANPQLESTVDASTRAAVDQARDAVIAGDVELEHF